MTTTVKIKHEGPGHHDIEVLTAHPQTGVVHGPAVRLSAGMSAYITVWDGQGIAIREIEKSAEQAVGGIGQVGVDIKPHLEIKDYSFEDFVWHGLAQGGYQQGGMPWSFDFFGHPVTHENDDCYLIGKDSVRFERADKLLVNTATNEFKVVKAG